MLSRTINELIPDAYKMIPSLNYDAFIKLWNELNITKHKKDTKVHTQEALKK